MARCRLRFRNALCADPRPSKISQAVPFITVQVSMLLVCSSAPLQPRSMHARCVGPARVMITYTQPATTSISDCRDEKLGSAHRKRRKKLPAGDSSACVTRVTGAVADSCATHTGAALWCMHRDNDTASRAHACIGSVAKCSLEPIQCAVRVTSFVVLKKLQPLQRNSAMLTSNQRDQREPALKATLRLPVMASPWPARDSIQSTPQNLTDTAQKTSKTVCSHALASSHTLGLSADSRLTRRKAGAHTFKSSPTAMATEPACIAMP